LRESERCFQEKGFPVKGRAGYFSGSKGERWVFSGQKGFPVKGRGENGILFREIEKDFRRKASQ
jgi:hypothetical protein